MLSGICVSTRQNPTLQPLPDKPEQKEKSDEQNIFELEKEFGFDNLDTKEKFIKSFQRSEETCSQNDYKSTEESSLKCWRQTESSGFRSAYKLNENTNMGNGFQVNRKSKMDLDGRKVYKPTDKAGTKNIYIGNGENRFQNVPRQPKEQLKQSATQQTEPIPDMRITPNETLLVKVGGEVEPNRFYLINTARNEEYEEMKLKMKSFYEKLVFPCENVQVNSYYAYFDEDTKQWTRVQMLNNNSNFCHCFFVDHGITKNVPTNKFFILDNLFKVLPRRSFQATFKSKCFVQ